MPLNLKLDTFTTAPKGSDTIISGLGFSPKAVILFYSGITDEVSGVFPDIVTSGAVAYTGPHIGLAAVSSGNSCVGISYYSPLDAGDSSYSNAAITYGVVTNYRLPPENFLADGFKLSYVYIETDAKFRVNYLALGGSDITNTKVGTFNSPGSLGEYEVNIGWQPDMLFIMSAHVGGAGPGTSSSALYSVGMATGPNEQGHVGIAAQGVSNSVRYVQSGEVIGYPNTYPNVYNRQAFVGFTASGFKLRRIETTTVLTNHYLAIQGGRWKVGNIKTRTDYDLITASGLGFIPEGVFFIGAGIPMSTVNSCSTHATMLVGAATALDDRVADSFNLMQNSTPILHSIGNYQNEALLSIYSGGISSLMDYYNPSVGGFKTIMDIAEPSTENAVIYLAIGDSFQPSIKPAYICGSGYIITPDSDITTSGIWKNESGGSTLYPSVADFDENTYAWYDNAEWGSYFEVGLANPPRTPSGLHSLVWRGKRKAGTRQTTLRCDLRQGSSIIASDLQTISDSVEHEYVKHLTQSEINSISDYTDLRIRITILDII